MGLSGLWLAQAALLNPGQPPRVNGSSTRSTNPTLRKVTTCRSTSEDRQIPTLGEQHNNRSRPSAMLSAA
jgi:hypothetical protein